ncbi:aminotransferase class I/II-fold pyridoxal phosphate-dependent enzyme [Emticicia fluvialis]|uniref:aminotransferase class I/II-fold pyridoxal phosphate-dependent enzyme n=1 Tax=Emticicia fluvialis TaxID=2974474 RepID=UPI0021659570|nr:aminotransferase class I/II-fold pyridoxal phosphate-dependent enzyme [Emticicia fluvialis]
MKELPKQMSYVNDVFSSARDLGLIQVRAQQGDQPGRSISLNGKSYTSFMSNNYLAFENDERVKEAAIEGIRKYGMQTSISRMYMSFDHYLELEEKLEKIFGLPTFLSSCTTLGHFAYLPVIIGKNDAVILDQFVHESVQLAANTLKADGYHVEVIKHSQMDMLERRIKMLSEKFDNVWYLADSVYSMHGDLAPLKDVETLLNAYDKFKVYIDDAHGMSWIGQNGKGYALHNIPRHEKMYVITSLNKGFGAFSSALIFPNQLTKQTVYNCGGALRFSAPTLHAGITAASCIADIHLSDEIYERQMRLNELITVFKQKAQALNLPIVNYSHTPQFFLGLGSVELLIRFSQFLMSKEFLLSPSTVPAVPVKHSGFRISLSLYQTVEDVTNLLDLLAEYIEVLEKEGSFNKEQVLKGFKMRDNQNHLV